MIMKSKWTPSTSDLAWTRRLFSSLKMGGVWGCPAGFSAWIKASDTLVTFDGPLNDGDKLPDMVPDDLADDALAGCLQCNRRIVVCLNAIGMKIVSRDNVTITPDPEWTL